jgi:hypothetical protein
MLLETAWKVKSLDEIESQARQSLQQLGTLLIHGHHRPARLPEIKGHDHSSPMFNPPVGVGFQ